MMGEENEGQMIETMRMMHVLGVKMMSVLGVDMAGVEACVSSVAPHIPLPAHNQIHPIAHRGGADAHANFCLYSYIVLASFFY